MNKIDISIIVPIYNAESYIDKCIKSLINQTKKELEFILINDGSTDNSEERINAYDDSRIRYYKNKNQGIGKTRNFGIEKANGKYLMFLDSDDFLEKDACEKLFAKAEKEKLDIVVCDYCRVYYNKKELKEIPNFPSSSLKDNPKLLRIINLGPCNKIYLAKMIKNNKIKFVENLKYEDVPFVTQSLAKAKKIGKINKSLHNYLIHDKSETTVRDKRCFDILKIVDIIRNNLEDEEYLKEELDGLTVRIITNYNIQQRYQSDKSIAMNFIDKSFAYLKRTVPNYKNNKYYYGRGIKKIIEKSKLLTKIYCKLYK